MSYYRIVYFAPLPGNQTNNSDVYCQKQIKLDKAIKRKQSDFSNNKQQCKTSFMIGNSWKNTGTWLQSLLGDYIYVYVFWAASDIYIYWIRESNQWKTARISKS